MRFARLAWSFHVRDGVWSGSSRGLCASGRERLGAILARVDVSEGKRWFARRGMDRDEGDSRMLPIGDDQRTATGARRRYRAGNTSDIVHRCDGWFAIDDSSQYVSESLLHSISYVIKAPG